MWESERFCARHVRVDRRTKTRIRMTTTFAWRVFPAETGGAPAGTVVRRGDERAVAGPPERCGRFDKFVVPEGYVLVPRSRWAWV
ncbi:hypothetical protein R5W24_004332 [Gemmata sp. JC717]|uniref:hypothetical protein n=1 Tax=Gemmata algarum TaxID=2975278 RepID=UPI0021BA9014|nr:hypothetical protein [Gemmata algarum]MDY3555194.1 hypothetical protein [Gemmata algarum]